MNRIRESMEGIRASRELKAGTLRYLERQRGRISRPVWRRGPSYALAAAICLLLVFGVGWHRLYSIPTSYISMDVNPSIELGINRYGRVVEAEAYNEDGRDVLRHLSLKNKPYVQAVGSLLEDEAYRKYLADNATLIFTVISDSPDIITEELVSLEEGESYRILIYTSDSHCMEEAHQHEMSFGKYRAYLELAEYDRSVTVEDCHGMSMGEIQDRIEGCRQHEETEHSENHGCGSTGSGDTGGGGEDIGSGDVRSGSIDTGSGVDGIESGSGDRGSGGESIGIGNTGSGSGDGNTGSGDGNSSGGGSHGGHHGGHHGG